MTVPKALTDLEQYFYAQVAVNFGTPPQTIPLTVDLSSDLLAVFSEDCDLCGGSTFFDQTESSTFQVCWTNLRLLRPFCMSFECASPVYLAIKYLRLTYPLTRLSQDPIQSWPNATAQFNGSYVHDVVNTGQLGGSTSQFGVLPGSLSKVIYFLRRDSSSHSQHVHQLLTPPHERQSGSLHELKHSKRHLDHALTTIYSSQPCPRHAFRSRQSQADSRRT